MSFLVGLPSEFETAKSQILSGSDISSLQEAFSRILHTESSANVQSTQHNNALISRHSTFEPGKQYRSSGNKGMGSTTHDRSTGTRGQEPGELVCHYCHKPGHIK